MINLPAAFTERMKQMLGREYDAFIASYDKERSQGLRVNGLKTDPGPYAGCKCSDESCEEWVFSQHGHGGRLSETGWNSAVLTRIRRSDRYSECISGNH